MSGDVGHRLTLHEFRDLGAAIHKFRCTSGDCRHWDDPGYFTPRDNDAASAASGWLAARHDFREFWMDWDSERSAAWLRERYLSFRLHHAELQTYASPEEFADLFVEWCRPKEDPYLCVTCRTASDDCSSDADNCCSGCRHTVSGHQSRGVVLTEEDGPECETCGKQTCPDAQLPAFSQPVNCEFEPIYRAIRDSKDCDYGCSRDYTNQAICLWIAPEIERIVAARLVAQAGRVAEVVEKVLARDRCRDVHETTYTDPWCESCRSWARHVTARVAAELEADQ